ncbi:MAG TPA: extracellular solute-binding protein [Limnochordia bacterium]
MSASATKLGAIALLALLYLAVACAAAAKTPLVFATRGGAFDAAGVELRKALADALIAAFERENPDIDVAWLRVSDDDYADKIVTLAAAGQLPDVFEAWGNMGTVWAERGLLLDLAPYVRRDLSAAELRDIFANVWEAPVVRVGPNAGMRYAVPRYLNVVIFYYNRTLFDNAGLIHLDDLDAPGDWTWERLVEYGKKLTRKAPDGTFVQYALRTDRGVGRSAAWAWANGGGIFNYPEDPTEFTLDAPASIEGYEFLYDLRWQHEIWPPNAPGFDQGQTAMDNTIATDSLASMTSRIGDAFEWDVAPRPMGRAERGTRTSLDLYVVSRSTAHPEAAWRFIRFLISPQAQLLHAKIQGMVPIRKSLYDEFVALNREKSLAAFFEGAIGARVDPTAVMLHADEAAALIDQALEASIERNEKPVKQAIEEIAPAIRSLYR